MSAQAKLESGPMKAADLRATERSAVMRAVKSRDTRPELMLRNMLRSIALGYRLHRVDLPGKPDIVYGPRRLAIFMHGCFWHGHDCKRGARPPKENAAYWSAKIARNRARDEANLTALADLGWRTLVVFDCALKDKTALERRLREALAADKEGEG
jgi:DNA mismatch endonuclease (patch repair protein)